MSMGNVMDPAGDQWHDSDTAVISETDHKVARPKPYKVLLLNDDYTSMEFVVMILVDVFHHNEEQAMEIMLNVHRSGSGLAGVYTWEVAETKAKKVTDLARQNSFPLRCALEPA